MNRISTIVLSVLLTGLTAQADVFDREEIVSRMKRAAGWQIENPTKHNALEWHCAPFYMGLSDLSEITGDRTYIDEVKAMGAAQDWNFGRRRYHADDHAIGLSYLKLYELDKDPVMIAKVQAEFDAILANPPKKTITDKNGVVRQTYNRERWNWCDALYMSPPVWAGLSAITGDQKYNDYMVKEWKQAHEWYYCVEEDLYFHDKRDIVKTSKAGQRVFWARGDGWVIGALVEVLQYLPVDHPDRSYFENIFKAMSTKLIAIQKDNGIWAPNLLDPTDPPQDDTSGTVFYVYGLAWGINNGLLDRAIYEPATLKGWQALCDRQKESGRLINTQPVGGYPKAFDPDTTEIYAMGAFISAGSEVYKMVGGSESVLSQDEASTPRTYCRFVPERADDFAWENDKVAFRAYGPKLRDRPEDSGIDCWLKRVDYPIIDKWYEQNPKGKSYHRDHGEGYDPYHVGSSRGCGGLGLWIDGKMVTSDTYTEWKIIKSDKQESVFVLTYEWSHGTDTYKEEKQISIQLGDQLFRSVSTFWKNHKLAVGLPIAVGVSTHDGKAVTSNDQAAGWMACWETIDGFGLGTGVVLDPEKIREYKLIDSPKKDQGHALVITRTDAKGQVAYRMGYGWEKAGVIKTSDAWNSYLERAAKNH